MMKQLEIFDPAMCCSTGVCGPSIDPELMRMATTIHALREKGIVIKRHGLSTEPQDFISNKTMNELLQKEGVDILPVTLIENRIVKTKTYPNNEELSKWLEVEMINDSKWKTNTVCCGPKGCC